MNCTAMKDYLNVSNLCDYCKFTGLVEGVSPASSWKQLGVFTPRMLLPIVLQKLSESALSKKVLKKAAKIFSFIASYIVESAPSTPSTSKSSNPLIPIV
uniref:Ovule protein n=1 Tax=Strongyloides venezuelensis TaxID=75913 RepID=A0A0K0FPR8_STRVS